MIARELRLPRWVFPAAVVAFTVLPLLELVLLVWLGRRVGVVPTLLLCAATGFAGAWLARWQGFVTLQRAHEALARGRFPADEIGHGALLLVGGVVLLTPGLVTDAIGFALLIPPTRSALLRLMRRSWRRSRGVVDGSVFVEGPGETERRVEPAAGTPGTAGDVVDGEVIDGEVVDGGGVDPGVERAGERGGDRGARDAVPPGRSR